MGFFTYIKNAWSHAFIPPHAFTTCTLKFTITIVYIYQALDGPGIEYRWGRDFLHLSKPALKPTQPPVQWVPGLSLG